MEIKKKTGIVVRIPLELDKQIRDFARNNRLNYSTAGRELARLNDKFKGKSKIFKEIRF